MVENVSFKDLLDQSLDARDPFLAAACHPYADTEDRRALENVLFATPKLKRRFAGAMYTPASVLDRLTRDNDHRIRLRVAKHPAAAPATLVRLAGAEGAEDLHACIACHRNAPSELLGNLFRKHPNSNVVRRALCQNPQTSLPLLRQLVARATSLELKGVARNAEADEALLRLCWRNPDAYLRAEVAAHPKFPSDLMESAEHAPQALVRRKLAQNPAVPDALLVRLLEDTEAQVRAAAVRQLSAPMLTALDPRGRDPSRQVRRDQARHSGLPRLWICRLAQDTDHWVRRLIARNPAADEETLRYLAEDVVTEVRRGVARNPSCPGTLLEQLARDPQPWVRAGVALRENIAVSLMVELSQDTDIDVLSALGRNQGAPQKILQRITRHEDRDVRRAVILNRNASRCVLRGLLEDPYPLNRVLLAGHRNLDAMDLMGLLHDPEPPVRFASAQTMAARLH